MGNQRTRIRRRAKGATSQGVRTVLPIRDVDDLVMGYLNFEDRRQMSKVNTYYQQKFRKDLEIPRRWEYVSNLDPLLAKFMANRQVDACQWILQRRPSWIKPTIYWFAIEYNSLEVLRWLVTTHSLPVINLRNPNEWMDSRMKYLAWALKNNRLEIADYLFSWLNEQTAILPEDLLSIGRYGNGNEYQLPTIRWIDRIVSSRGLTINWTPIMNRRLPTILRSKNFPLLDFSLEVGCDWSQHQYHLWSMEDSSLFEWGKKHLTAVLDILELYNRAIASKKFRLIKWLLQQGYSAPPTAPLSSIDQTAFSLLYAHHQDNLWIDSDSEGYDSA